MKKLCLVLVIFYCELARLMFVRERTTRDDYLFSLITKNTFPRGKYLLIYAISVFEGVKDSRKLVSVIPELKVHGTDKLKNSLTIMHIAEASFLECDISSYTSVKEYIDLNSIDSNRVLNAFKALDSYYKWLIDPENRLQFSDVFVGFFLFRSQFFLIRGIHHLQNNEPEKFRKDIAYSLKFTPEKSQLYNRVKEVSDAAYKKGLKISDVRNYLLNGQF